METTVIPMRRFIDTAPREGVRYTVTSRHIRPDIHPDLYLSLWFPGVPADSVCEIFGSTTRPSPLYGGRAYDPGSSLTDAQIAHFRDRGIGLSLTLTNHFFDEDSYAATLPLLREHHRPGNSVICVNDTLARRIRQDFPDYALKASLIKHLTTAEKIAEALEVYDVAVLPMDLNENVAFLDALADKDRIMLFGDANCAFNCPARICYTGISRHNKGADTAIACSQPHLPRADEGYVLFDVARLRDMGFRRFKFVSTPSPSRMEAAQIMSRRSHWFVRSQTAGRPLALVHSFPKAGRTWLRFILARYLARRLKLRPEVTLSSMFHLIPNDVGDDVKGPGAYRLADRGDLPVILFSHATPAQAAPQTATGAAVSRVLLVRDAAETLVSYYHHRCFHGEGAEPSIALDDFLPEALSELTGYCNAWADALAGDPPLIVSYADLHADPAGTVARVLGALGIAVEADALAEAVAGATFERMRAAEALTPVPGTLSDPADPRTWRMRRGRSGAAAEELSPAQLAMIADHLNRHLAPAVRRCLGDRLMPPRPGATA